MSKTIEEIKLMPLRTCTSCQHQVRDDGKGGMRPCGHHGGHSWMCSGCTARAKKAEAQKKRREKLRTGRKPGRPGKAPVDYDSSELSSVMDDREYIRKFVGI